MDFKLWRKILYANLGKACKKKADDVILDILAVDEGIKPSFLYDTSCATVEKLIKIMCELYGNGLIQNKLIVLSIEEDYFLARRDFVQVLETLSPSVSLIDVSDNLTSAEVVPSLHSIQTHRNILTLLKTIDINEDKIDLTETFHNINKTTVFGVLLGYPVVYWYTEESINNCLNMVPLLVFSVNFASYKELQLEKEHSAFSFSVPHNLSIDFKDLIDDWFKRLQSSSTARLKNPKMLIRTEIVPYVGM